jgi:uncharacterized protein (TIGR03382 family)
MGAMRRVLAWFGVATLIVLTSTASAANDVLKPYVVLILDTSGSMNAPTGAGPTSCGKIDNRINHAVCAINSIVNSYGDMVFSLARFREITGGSYTSSCDANGDQEGNHNLDGTVTLPINLTPSGGDQCSTQGPFCGDCSTGSGLGRLCNGNSDCFSNRCVSGRCANPTGAGTANTTTICTTADDAIEILTPLVDGNNSSAALVTNGSCTTCGITGTEPEIWGVSQSTFTPLAAVLNGVRRYWQGLQATNAQTIWGSTLAGYDPINRDPQNAVFLQATGAAPASCNSDHATCNPSVSCTGSNCCCDTCNPNPTTCTALGNPVTCTGPNCCCATQCRPYVTILLTDGDETCANFNSSTLPAAASLLNTSPRQDNVNVSTFSRSTNVTTATTSGAHALAVGNTVVISGFGDATYNGTYVVTSVANATTFTFANTGSNSPGAISGSPAVVRHAASDFNYHIETKPIGFGKTPGDAEIEAIAHSGGAADLPGVNEGYYAANEQDLQLAISQILADSVRSESCNGRDDDCDTRIDEDFPNKNQSCQAVWPVGDPKAGHVAVGICANTGTSICRTDGTGTQCNANPNPRGNEGSTCNTLDDDCDGFVDEGLPCQQCVPTGEICDGNDNDCDGVADQTCRCSNNNTVKCDANNDCGTGTCVCTGITQGCSNTVPNVGTCPGVKTCTNGSFGTCQGQTPTAEQCNGLDDDCNGVCDDITNDCSEVGTTCNPNVASSCPASGNPGDPSHGAILHPESGLRCQNTTDDDGDGVINDGCPIFPAVGGVAETACNDAVDNDNDGRMNDGCPTVATGLIPQNVCHAGQKTCPVPLTCPAASNQFGICSGEVKPAASDACNALDDDCDNAIDEDFTPADCSTNCGIGTTQCVNGEIKCNSVPATNDNTCNNVDDDCDGKFDENWVCDPSPTCTGLDCCVCGTGTTCEKNKCINGVRTCVVDPPINPEVCDCEDNNCNQQVDEGTLCSGGAQCVGCQCAFPCDPNTEFACPVGKRCIQPANTKACTGDGDCASDEFCDVAFGFCKTDLYFCVNDPCYGETCGPATNGDPQKCIANPDPSKANEHLCVPVCQGVTCATNEVCLPCPGGVAEGCCQPNNCVTFPNMCTANQSCVGGTCVTNPCSGVTCASDQYCLGGTCVKSCADLECAAGQRCTQGMCETDPCGHACPFGQVCNDNTGKCIDDPCRVVTCDTGKWCNPGSGQCEDDPCVINDVTCPNPEDICRGGSCIDPDSLRPDAAGEAHVTVGGGGGCSTTGNSSTGVLLALALLVIRRRRVSRASRREGGAL